MNSLDKVKACNKKHRENLGITNDLGYFCSFLHAYNFARDREVDSLFYKDYKINLKGDYKCLE